MRTTVLALTILAAGAAACSGMTGPGSSLSAEIPESSPTMSSPTEYGARPISAEAGADYFLRTGGGDPYAAGLAYPIFLALMEAYPEELGRDWNELADKFGLIRDPAAKGDPHAPPIGFHVTTDPNTGVPWVVGNCQFCHADRLHLETGDVVVAGLGSKRVRAHAYANALARIGTDSRLNARRITELATARANAWGIAWPKEMRRPIVDATLAAFSKGAARRAPSLSQLAQGLPGRAATIESFTIALNDVRSEPIAFPKTIGWTKVPDVRGFPFRETFSYDASGYGSPQALTLEADFVFGARPEWYVSHPHIATSTYLYLRSFSRKLPFPRRIEASLTAHGKTVFEARCAQCHGFYVDHGDEMRVSYRERVIPKETVGTDPARADAVTPAFVEASNALPLTRGYTRVHATGGYVPPVLLDVWARGLFGHAGQWPSLEVLATPPGERPRAFVVDPNGFYDLDRVGVRYEAVTLVDGSPYHVVQGKLVPRPLQRGEYLYDGQKPGYRPDGHSFLADLPPSDRAAVIEYLKTLSSP